MVDSKREYRSPAPDASAVEIRISYLEKHFEPDGMVDRLGVKMDRLIDMQGQKNLAHVEAVERCAAKGREVDAIKVETIPRLERRIEVVETAKPKRDPLMFWSVIVAVITAVGGIVAIWTGHAP